MYKQAYMSAVSMLKVEEVQELNAIQLTYKSVFNKGLEAFGISDMRAVFAHLMTGMIDYSTGNKNVKLEDFKNILTYHFKAEGSKYYIVLVKIFAGVFEALKASDVTLIKLAAELELAEALDGLKEGEFKIENNELYIRRRKL